MSTEKVYYATGKRKTSSARIFLKAGSGKVQINKLPAEKYLKRISSQKIFVQPLEATNMKQKVDLFVTVAGGGESGQAGAIRHGISRALVAFNPDLRPTLKEGGYLTRDSRMVERKKYGQHKARKSTQYSKR